MKKSLLITTALAVSCAIFLAWPSAFASLLEAPYAGFTSTITVPSNYHFVDAGWTWTATEKAVIKEALREWDVRICDVTTFVEDPAAGFSFDWAGDAVFNNNSKWGQDFSNVLALTVPAGATAPDGVAKNEIYFNVKYSWYVDPTPGTDEKNFLGYDLLSVAKHEIGHILGITGDYTDPTRRSEVMWYAFAEGERRHPTEKDFDQLRSLGYHVDPIPEPATMVLFGTGVAGLAAVGRRKKV